jgi:hypothetical protein
LRRDAVVGLVGAAILLVALVGVFRFESQPPGPTYVLAQPLALPPIHGSAAPNQAYVIPQPIPYDNMTSLDFTLEASGGTFNLSVAGPDGVTHAAEGTGRVVLTIAFPAPANGTAAPPPTGPGTWNVTVTLKPAASPAPVTPPTVPVVGGSNEVSFTVTPRVTLYAAR